QGRPQVAAAGNGDFVVVWESRWPGSYGIFGQRYASNGIALGTEFQVNTYTANYPADPAVAVAENGDFVVVWHGEVRGSYQGFFAQRYGSSGGALGPESQVTPVAGGPQVAAASNGDFVVVWVGDDGGSSSGIFGQRYASNGSALGTAFQVNSYTPR